MLRLLLPTKLRLLLPTKKEDVPIVHRIDHEKLQDLCQLSSQSQGDLIRSANVFPKLVSTNSRSPHKSYSFNMSVFTLVEPWCS